MDRFARASSGKTIIAYLPSSQTVTINMSGITDASGQANCHWFNPSTGAVTHIGKIANKGAHNFTSPDSNDWVLVIDSAEAGLGAPGT
jgi:Putative collagen-binding domain of a collagenase